ncbi:MAG TPA: hypothetical protein VFW73_10990 [Lacipirellulaceae bacterium]|nr:hypothetical protein [Lacipirellulaceae bacterium]
MNDAIKQDAWVLHGNEGELCCNTLAGQINTARPHEGLHNLRLSGVPWPVVLLSAYPEAEIECWPSPLGEAYVRGEDLVATYQATTNWPFSPQLYWRANSLESPGGVMASLSLLVSIQTQLLDTYPRIRVTSHVACGEVLLLTSCNGARPCAESIDRPRTVSPSGETCCILLRLKEWPLTYVEMVPSSDFRQAKLQRDNDGVSTEWSLFADFLEKGVIRRARVHAALLARENDVDLAMACCEAARRLELPLTT